MGEPVESDLQVVVPVPKELTIKGEKVLVHELEMGQISQMIRSLAPLISVIRSHSSGVKDADTLKTTLMEIFLSNPDELMVLLGISVGKPIEWVHKLNTKDTLELSAAVVEVNLDFFMVAVLPFVLRVMAQLGVPEELIEKLRRVGQMSSSSSSPTATDTKISSDTPTASS